MNLIVGPELNCADASKELQLRMCQGALLTERDFDLQVGWGVSCLGAELCAASRILGCTDSWTFLVGRYPLFQYLALSHKLLQLEGNKNHQHGVSSKSHPDIS